MMEEKTYPTLNKVKDVLHKNTLITIYEDSDGRVVLGGLGWLERFYWEKTYCPPTSEAIQS